MTFKIILPFFLLLIYSCSNSFEKISLEQFKSNEEAILSMGYSDYFYSKEYENGVKLNMPTDELFIHCLNMNKSYIDFSSIKTSEFKAKWSDLSLDADDINKMIENNIPILQQTWHWYDAQSPTGNNGWETRTLFYPECKYENNKLIFGKCYAYKGKIEFIKYYPCVYQDPQEREKSRVDYNEMIMAAYGAEGSSKLWNEEIDISKKDVIQDIKINYNGSILKMWDKIESDRKENEK